MRRFGFAAGITVAIASSLALAGCVTASPTSAGAGSTGPATSKTNISVMYAFTGTQEVAFKQDLNAWASKNGLTITYLPSTNFQTQIVASVKAGKAPDIAIFPQPGILKTLAAQGAIAPLNTQTDVANIEKNIPSGFLSTTTVNNVVYGAPYSMNVKSLWWYDKKVWAAKGYTPPTDQTQLLALIDKIKASGASPICYGMQSQGATGWPGTDWIEDYVLQTSGPQVYNDWIAGKVKFNSTEIRKAFAIYQQLIMTPGNVYGGATNSVNVVYSSAFNPMFASNPGCYMGKQGNFITSFFPADVQSNLDSTVGVFQTPTVNGSKPVEGGGDLVAALTKNDTNVKKVVNLLTNDPTFGINSAKTGAFLSPQRGFATSNYPNKLDAEIAGIAFNASSFSFDASDAMPPAVGSGSFWTGMVNLTDGTQSLDQVLTTIDSSWPAS